MFPIETEKSPVCSICNETIMVIIPQTIMPLTTHFRLEGTCVGCGTGVTAIYTFDEDRSVDGEREIPEQ